MWTYGVKNSIHVFVLAGLFKELKYCSEYCFVPHMQYFWQQFTTVIASSALMSGLLLVYQVIQFFYFVSYNGLSQENKHWIDALNPSFKA